MKNRMQDLDFEQTVAFDKVQDYEFTRRAAQRFRQVVSLDSFEDEDADYVQQNYFNNLGKWETAHSDVIAFRALPAPYQPEARK